jgi:hypothetical protein
MVRGGLFAVLFLTFTGAVFTQEVRLTAVTDTGTFRIGSWIDVHVTGSVSNEVESIDPVIVRDSIGLFEVLKVERSGSEPRWLIRLMTVDSGQVFMPPVEFTYKTRGDTAARKAYTNSILLKIGGVAVEPDGDIRDIKPPMYAPWLFEDYLPYLIGIIIIAGAGLGFYLYMRRRKRKKLETVVVKTYVPPHREALTALRVLEEKRMWQQGLVKEYYSEVTEIIRRFFERRWDVIALELTSDEIMFQMEKIPEAMTVWKTMESFFLTADLVKFAKYQPSPEENGKEMKSAYDIVRAMVPKVPVAEGGQLQEVEADAGR